MNDSDEYRRLKGEIFFLNQKIDKLQNTLDGIVTFTLLFLCAGILLFFVFGFNRGWFS